MATDLSPDLTIDGSARDANAPQRQDAVVAAVLIGAYIAVRVWILAAFTPYVNTDSPSYGPVAGHPYLRTLSFTGDSPRTWGVPLLYNLVHSEWGRAAVQWTVGTLAWSVLAYGLWLHLRSRTARVVALVLILVLALNVSVYTWDYAIVSEPLSIDLGLLAMGLFAVWLKNRSWLVLALMVVSAFWWTFTRQDILPVVGIFVFSVAVAGLVGARSMRRRERIVAAGVVLLLLGGMAWATVIIPRVNVGFASWGAKYRLSDGTFLYRLRFVILPDPAERDVYYNDFGMPRCDDLQAIANGRGWNMTTFVADVGKCPELRAWVFKNGQSSGYRYAIKRPKHYLKVTVKELPPMLSGSASGHYATPVTVLPRAIDDVLYPSQGVTLPAAGIVMILSLGVALGTGAWRRRRWLLLAGVAMSFVGVGNAMATEMYAVGDYPRFGMQEAILLRIGLIILVVVAVESVLTRRRSADPATPVSTGSRRSGEPESPDEPELVEAAPPI